MTTPRSTLFVVDRIEGRGARARIVLVADDDAQIEISRAELGIAVTEGAVVRVPNATDGFEWSAAVRDRVEEVRRLEEAEAELRRLSAKDPGGDLEL